MIKINFLKFKKEKKFKKRSFDISISFYWKVLLYVSFIFIILAFVFGSYFFMKINKETVLPDIKASGQIEKVKKERIEKVLNYFTEKEQKTNSILISGSPVVDPSR